jgi:hypothetical protein
MKLTKDEVLERWRVFWSYADRVQELKDLTLDLKTIAETSEQLLLNEKKLKEIIEEIRYTYQECMIPILKDINSHIEEFSDDIDRILSDTEPDEMFAILDEVDALLAHPIIQPKAADVSGIKSMFSEAMIDEQEEEVFNTKKKKQDYSYDEEAGFEVSG